MYIFFLYDRVLRWLEVHEAPIEKLVSKQKRQTLHSSRHRFRSSYVSTCDLRKARTAPNSR